jgi:hypothetical protein
MAVFKSKQGTKAGALAVGLLLLAGAAIMPPMFAQEGEVPAQTVVTVMPKGNVPTGTQAPAATQTSLKVSVNEKPTPVTSFVPLRGDRAGLELVVLIDDSARTRLAQQFSSLKAFINSLPAQTQVGVAQMENGRAVFHQNLTADHEAVANALRIPFGSAGSSASPYFCLSDLAKHWPSADPDNRREVLMITDGIDLYNGRRFDPEDPYVAAAIADSQRARLIVHSIFYMDAGDGSGGQIGGQDYLLMVAKDTGGRSYYQMAGNPVSFDPYLDDLHTRLMNQYELGFMAQPRGRAELQDLKVKATTKKISVDAPEKVLVPGSEDRSQR